MHSMMEEVVKRHLIRNMMVVAGILTLAPAAPAQVASEAVDLDVVDRIRREGLENSHMEELARHLTDVIGPRLTNSPGMTRANEWTAEKLREWGLILTWRADPTPDRGGRGKLFARLTSGGERVLKEAMS